MKLVRLTGLLFFVFLVNSAQKECSVVPFVQKQQSCFRQIHKEHNNLSNKVALHAVLDLPSELLVHCLSYDPLGHATSILWSKIQLSQGGADILAQALMRYIKRITNEYTYGVPMFLLKKIGMYLRYIPQKYASNPDALYVKNVAMLVQSLYQAFYRETGTIERIELQRKRLFVNNKKSLALHVESFQRVFDATPAHALSLWYAYLVFKNGKNINEYCAVLKPFLPLSIFPKLSRFACLDDIVQKSCKTCWLPAITIYVCCCAVVFVVVIYSTFGKGSTDLDGCATEGQACSCNMFCYRGQGICSYKSYVATCIEVHKSKGLVNYFRKDYPLSGDKLHCYCPYNN